MSWQIGNASVTNRRWILLPGKGYCYGVETGTEPGPDQHIELHGGFRTWEEAHVYKGALLEEYDGYEFVRVVKIETPVATAPRPPQGGLIRG